MSAEPAADYKKYRLFWLVLSLGLSLLLIFLTFGMYRNAARKDRIGSRGKLVYMKITRRERGAGTLKFPNHIYAEYQGVEHDFTCGSKFFRGTMKADSIEVRLDLTSGAAALPGSGRVRHEAFLYVMIMGISLIMIWKSIQEFIKFS
ncbi:MAG: hypothetical protein BGO21_21345 [Dyadobacter sp. 50-39]|uniref:hypothetical protein n=1 Tax=Dyadobacter sp. 50-39 TaxID=1895756 RepID=UPI00096701CB|nr:hypothetical protein [Dyadobacter sp. 50-39]OJV19236.1 MAG: hypothetical protein BGO21_21345 [Dyadobacter sp. 50-39]